MAKLERENFCPIIKDKCKGINCNFYIQLTGKHPQTGKDIDEWGCSFAWLPMLMIETSKEVRQGAAATESFRNVMVRLAAGEDPNILEYEGMKKLNGG